MNFDPTIITPVAIFMALSAPAMWGSWFVCLKFLDENPIEVFYIILFTTSMVLVWGIGLILDGPALIDNIVDVWIADPSRVYISFICGVLYVTGMQFSLRVINIIGLSLSQPIQSSINVIGGTLISALIGGIPAGISITRLGTATTFLFLAVFLSLAAGRIRNLAQEEQNIDTGLSRDSKSIKKAIVFLVIASIATPAYSTGLSYGLKSITQPNGMAVMPFMAVLCTGAFTGAIFTCCIILTIRKQWYIFFKNGWKIYKLGIISGLAHYGGNIIHTFATRNLSTVVSWPLGLTAGLWTQMWGIKFGEFRGAPKKAYIWLIMGIVCYLVGAFTIANIV
ncbi:MAG TPA: hypothetical protein G4N92_00440 [Anaerolineae bacterium]|nr:hypothetical protein [Anaerolineae bacterium]